MGRNRPPPHKWGGLARSITESGRCLIFIRSGRPRGWWPTSAPGSSRSSTASWCSKPNMTAESHGFSTSRGPMVHGGAIATLADEALASVAFTLAEEGETTVTADLKVDFLQPANPGRLVARATVRHRTRRLAFCEATVEHAQGQIVAEARAVIAYVKA